MGDLTNFGEVELLRVKLVIADTLATPRVENMSDEEHARYHEAALEIMAGLLAKEAGITYLQEGTYTFTLSNGSIFKAYALPYTAGSGS